MSLLLLVSLKIKQCNFTSSFGVVIRFPQLHRFFSNVSSANVSAKWPLPGINSSKMILPICLCSLYNNFISWGSSKFTQSAFESSCSFLYFEHPRFTIISK